MSYVGEKIYEANMARELQEQDKRLQADWLKHNDITVCITQKQLYIELPTNVVPIPTNKKE